MDPTEATKENKTTTLYGSMTSVRGSMYTEGASVNTVLDTNTAETVKVRSVVDPSYNPNPKKEPKSIGRSSPKLAWKTTDTLLTIMDPTDEPTKG